MAMGLLTRAAKLVDCITDSGQNKRLLTLGEASTSPACLDAASAGWPACPSL